MYKELSNKKQLPMLDRLAGNILSGVWSFHPRFEPQYRHLASRALRGEKWSSEEIRDAIQQKEKATRTYYATPTQNLGDVMAIQVLGEGAQRPAGSTAIMRISGPIYQEDGVCTRGLDGYEEEIRELGQDSNVDSVLIEMNSPGGTAIGGDVLSDLIKDFESMYNKPIAALISNLAASAGYLLIAQAPRIFVNSKTAEAGSIGTMISMLNEDAWLEKEGLKQIVVRASKSWNKNEAYYRALQGDAGPIKREVLDPLNEQFHRIVRNGRRGKLNLENKAESEDGQSVPEVLTGKVYIGQSIVDAGLADEIGNRQKALQYLRRQVVAKNNDNDKKKKKKQMNEILEMSLEQLEVKQAELAAIEQQTEDQRTEAKLVQVAIASKQKEALAAELAEAKKGQGKATDLQAKVAELEAKAKEQEAAIQAKETAIEAAKAKEAELQAELEKQQEAAKQLETDVKAYQDFNAKQRKTEAFAKFAAQGRQGSAQPEAKPQPKLDGLTQKEKNALWLNQQLHKS